MENEQRHVYGNLGFLNEESAFESAANVVPKGTRVYVFKIDNVDTFFGVKRGTLLCWKTAPVPELAYDIVERVV